MTTGTREGSQVSRILESFRRWGYLAADLDPLGRLPPAGPPELAVGGEEAAAARAIYCGTLAVEFMHIPEPDRRTWIAQRMEAPPLPFDRRRILDQLVRSEVFEETIQTRYIGSKRFSIEGVAALIPLLLTAIEESAELGAEQAMIAMSHRGRLNVMTQVIGRTPVEIFAGFEDVDPRSVLGCGRRQVPPRRYRHPGDPDRQDGPPASQFQSEPSRSGELGRDGADARQAHPRRRLRREEDGRPPPARRLGFRRPGDRRRDAQLRRPRRLRGRRRAADRGQQSDRLHHRARGLQLDALRDRHRPPPAGADLPRQRRGPGGRGAGGPYRHRLPLHFRQ